MGTIQLESAPRPLLISESQPLQLRPGHNYGPSTIHGGFNIFGDVSLGHSTQRTELLNSLYFPEMNTRRNDIKSAHHDTFEWVFRNDNPHQAPGDLAEWLRYGMGVYMVQGKAGSGKSTFLKFVYEHNDTARLLGEWAGGRVALLFHSFWLSGNVLQHNFKGLLASLMYQIVLECDITAEVLQEHTHPGRRRHLNDWAEGNLHEVVLLFCGVTHIRICIFLDGLDEFDQGDDVDKLLRFVDTLVERGCKICLSSRSIDHIVDHFNCPRVRLQDLTAHDIHSYAHGVLLEKTRHLADRNELVSRITDAICLKADGVFLWVHYVLANVCTGIRNREDLDMLYCRIELLPDEVIELYRKMWKLRNKDNVIHRHEATRLLSFAKYMPLMAFYLTIAVSDKLLFHYSHQMGRLGHEHLGPMCDDLLRRIGVRSAGLLESRELYTDHHCEINKDFMAYADESGCSWYDRKWRKTVVGLFHRTVFDFLHEEEARELIEVSESGTEPAAAVAIGLGFCAALAEDLITCSQLSVLKFLVLTQLDGANLEIIDYIGKTLTAKSSESSNTDSMNWVHKLHRQDWLAHRLTSDTLFVDVVGLQMVYLTGWSDLAHFLSNRSWSKYYYGYLMALAIEFSKYGRWSVVAPGLSTYASLCLFAEKGADMVTPQVLLSMGPCFLARGPILQVLAKTFASLLSPNLGPDDRTMAWDDLDVTISLLATYSSALWDRELSMEANFFGTSYWTFGRSSLQGPGNYDTGLFVTFVAADVLDFMLSHGPFRTMYLRDSSRKAMYHDLKAMYRSLVKRVIVYKQIDGVCRCAAIDNSSEVEHLLFERGSQKGFYEAEKLGGTWQDSVPSTSLIPDLYFTGRQDGFPCAPLDTYSEVAPTEWKKACTMRHYFQEIDGVSHTTTTTVLSKRRSRIPVPVMKRKQQR